MSDTDWYLVARDGRRYGPYDRGVVERLVRDRELRRDTPVWHPGLARWRDAGAVLGVTERAESSNAAPAAPRPVSRAEAPAARAAPARPKPVRPRTPKPPDAKAAAERLREALRVPAMPTEATKAVDTLMGHRALAAAIDVLLVAVLLRSVVGFLEIGPDWLDAPRFALLAWVGLEGWLVQQTGRTPGKALLGLRVERKDGGRLDERAVWLRTAAVPAMLLLMSLSTFFVVIGIGALFATASRVRAGHPVWWDQIAGTTVSQTAAGAARQSAAVVLFAVLVFACVLIGGGFS